MAESEVGILPTISQEGAGVQKRQASWKRGNQNKEKLLGMPFGTAMGRLRKSIMFELARRLGECVCYRCRKPIDTVEEFSIEHMEAWQRASDPVAAFFNIDNIAFSHHECNRLAATPGNKRFNSEAEWRSAYQPIHNERRRANYDPAERRSRYQRTGH